MRGNSDPCRAEYLSQWAALQPLVEGKSCSAGALRSERDERKRAALTCEERARLKDLERENRELKRANEILQKAPSSEFCAADASGDPAITAGRAASRLTGAVQELVRQ